jgi:hypothetical protein
MRQLMVVATMVLVGASGAFAADQTWTGKISDSKCGAKHVADEHGKKMTDRECTEACVKGGAKYVFASKGKVYQIANQDDADLAMHAGHTVKLTGEMKGDSITVSKINMRKGSKG